MEDVLCGSTYDRAAGREGTFSPVGAEEDPHEGRFSDQEEYATRMRPRPAPGCALEVPSRIGDGEATNGIRAPLGTEAIP